MSDDAIRQDLCELSVACRFTELFTVKATLAHLIGGGGDEIARAKAERTRWADQLAEAAQEYATCWRARNKESGLDEVLRALAAVADEIRAGGQ